MRLQIDLTGSSDARDELEYLQDARQAVHDLLLPDGDLDRAGRERLNPLPHATELKPPVAFRIMALNDT